MTQKGIGHLGKYLIVSIVLVFIVCMTVYLVLSNKRMPQTFAIFETSTATEDLRLTDGDIYVEDSVARKLFDEVKIYCWILTTKSGVLTKAAGVNFTWAPRCNKHVYFASAYGEETTPPPIPGAPVTEATKVTFNFSAGKREEFTTANGEHFATITMGDVVFVDSPEGYSNLTEKSREILQYIYLTELKHFDWFLKADDDTYVIMENMRFLLKGLDRTKPAYLGYQLEPFWFDSPYMSGGAGYVFNQIGIKLLVEKGLQNKGACKEQGSSEDLEVGRCAYKAGITIYSSMDKFERESFHPDRIEDYIPGPPPQWLHHYARNKPKGGSECCSQLSVSFHRLSTQEMLVFDHLLYKTSVYGRHMTGSFPQFFKYGAVKKLPNGIPTMGTR